MNEIAQVSKQWSTPGFEPVLLRRKKSDTLTIPPPLPIVFDSGVAVIIGSGLCSINSSYMRVANVPCPCDVCTLTASRKLLLFSFRIVHAK